MTSSSSSPRPLCPSAVPLLLPLPVTTPETDGEGGDARKRRKAKIKVVREDRVGKERMRKMKECERRKEWKLLEEVKRREGRERII